MKNVLSLRDCRFSDSCLSPIQPARGAILLAENVGEVRTNLPARAEEVNYRLLVQ